MRKPIAAVVSVLAATTALTATFAPAQAAPGTTSLAEVLAADGNKFDSSWKDFDVLDRAVRYVLAEKPDSPVAVLADGDTRLTAFAPTDRAFQRLVEDVSGTAPSSEKSAWQIVRDFAGADTIEQVLLYHVIAGQTINSQQAAQSDGAELTTAQGGTVTVDVKKAGIFLQDADTDDADPRLIPALLDINKGNKQIAHGINRVLRPIDL